PIAAAVVASRARVASPQAAVAGFGTQRAIGSHAGPVADERRTADAAPVAVAAVVEGARIAVVARRSGRLVCAVRDGAPSGARSSRARPPARAAARDPGPHRRVA